MITPGTILIESGTHLPQSFRLENESYPSAWKSMKSTLNSYELESELATTGWTFFYMAGEVRATAFGFDRQKAVHTALGTQVACLLHASRKPYTAEFPCPIYCWSTTTPKLWSG